MESQNKENAFLFSCKRQLLNKGKCVSKLLPNLRKSCREVGPWWQERLNWMKDDFKLGRVVLLDLVHDLRTGKRGIKQGFWKRPYFVTTVVAGLILIGGNIYLDQKQAVYAAYYNDEQIALVASQQMGERLQTSLEQELEKDLGQDVFLEGTLRYKNCLAPKREVRPSSYYASTLKDLPWMTKGVELCINDKPVAALASQDAGEGLLQCLQKSLLPKNSQETIEKVEFQEKITFQPKQLAVKDILPVEDALEMLMGGQLQEKPYVVKDGDSLWSIARAHDLIVEDINKANPELSTEKLSIGQELKLASVEPLINAIITSTQVTSEVIPCDVQTKSDSKLRWGQVKVVTAGESGEAKVTYRVVRQNQQVVQRQEVGRQVVKKPAARVVAKGTNIMLASRGSGGGVLRWPVGGGITSRYGPRGGRFHTGIDIGAGYGAAVGAAAGGRVTSTGWQGGYGKMVTINHGNGLSTRYAHLSSINVSTGQSVGSGQIIGKVGSTGNSTGPHLHFEVLANGSQRNPMNYLR